VLSHCRRADRTEAAIAVMRGGGGENRGGFCPWFVLETSSGACFGGTALGDSVGDKVGPPVGVFVGDKVGATSLDDSSDCAITCLGPARNETSEVDASVADSGGNKASLQFPLPLRLPGTAGGSTTWSEDPLP
jgi:hypothetical protein